MIMLMWNNQWKKRYNMKNNQKIFDIMIFSMTIVMWVTSIGWLVGQYNNVVANDTVDGIERTSIQKD